MTDKKLNIKLLRNLVLWARGESDRLDKKFVKLGEYNWRQQDWAMQEKNGVCQTAFCMAGAAVVMSGYKMIWDDWYDEGGNVQSRNAEICRPKGSKREEDTLNIPRAARDFLGITEREANRLFDGDNGIEDIEYWAARICEDRGKKLNV